MKVIKHSDIEALYISPLQYMRWIGEALMHQYDAQIPPKISIHLPNDGFFNTMPCYLPFIDAMGVKVVNRYLQNDPALDATLMLYEASSGKLQAIMDATLITSMRTGAVAATSIIKLRKESPMLRISLMGLGATARATILCLVESLPSVKIEIKLLKYKEQAELFVDRFTKYHNLSFSIIDNHQDLIVGADVIISCITSATSQIGQDEWFEEGVLLVPIHTRGFQNCDLFFDKVFGDVTCQVCHFKHFNEFRHFDEFARVVRGEVVGRQNNEERILVYNIGQALHDIYIATQIYRLLEKKELCDVCVKEPLMKFYI